MMKLFLILTVYHRIFKYNYSHNRGQEITDMRKKPLKKQTQLKKQDLKKIQYSEKRQRYYAFGFLVGEY